MAEEKRKEIRVESQSEAARNLGLKRTNFQRIARERPGWWREEFHTVEGYDVVGIALARQDYLLRRELATATKEKDAESEHEVEVRKAEIAEARAKARIAELEVMKRVRVEREKERSLINAEKVKSYHGEMLGEVRRLWLNFCYGLSRGLPPEVVPYVYVDEHVWKGKDISLAAPAQRAVLKIVDDFQAWLDRISVDIFTDKGEED